MLTCGEICDFMDRLYPLENAESWDNCGLLIGFHNNPVKNILLCLDVTDDTVDEAINLDCQMIISHHPVIFKSLKRVSGEDYIQYLVHKIIRNDICVYSAHTNMDISEGGTNDIMTEMLSLKNKGMLDGIGRYGELGQEMPMEEFVRMLKTLFNARNVRYTGADTKKVKKIALCTGAYDGNLQSVMKCKPDVFLTGEMKYHQTIDMVKSGVDAVTIGHFESEVIFKERLKYVLNNKYKDIKVILSEAETSLFK